MSAENHIPKGYNTVNAYLIVPNASELIDFVTEVFGANEVMRMPLPEGGVAHAEVRLGDSTIECADACEAWPAMPASLHVYVPDIDDAYERALAAGGKTASEPKDQFYGERSASVRDSNGNLWHIATKTEDLSIEEMKRRATEHHSE